MVASMLMSFGSWWTSRVVPMAARVGTSAFVAGCAMKDRESSE